MTYASSLDPPGSHRAAGLERRRILDDEDAGSRLAIGSYVEAEPRSPPSASRPRPDRNGYRRGISAGSRARSRARGAGRLRGADSPPRYLLLATPVLLLFDKERGLAERRRPLGGVTVSRCR